MKTFLIKSLGCKTNILEGEAICAMLSSAGFKEVEEFSLADIFILNSCTVTAHSDSGCSYLINRARRKNPDIKIILTGCVAQTLDLHKNFDLKNVDIVLGNIEKTEILRYIKCSASNDESPEDSLDGSPAGNADENHAQKAKCKIFVSDIMKQKTFKGFPKAHTRQTRASVKIQDGCNNRCSYCAIPYARGNSRSRNLEDIIDEINFLAASGTKEVVLTGIHITNWGLEFGRGLVDLLKQVETSDIWRYRLGSLYVNEADDGLIDFLKSSKKFCPHFHLSLQSLCDKTLAAMNRKYSASCAINLMQKLKKAFPSAFLGCDIIVGFPGESEEDFLETYENLKSSPLSKIHCFPYSKREGTPAATMKNQVREGIKTQRVQKISELSEDLHKKFLEENKNEKLEILFEKKSPKTGLYSAITRNYIKVYIKDDRDDLRNTLKIVDMSEFDKLY